MARDYQLPHILTRWRPISTDMYGKSTYSVAVIRCRYQSTERQYVNEHGTHSRSRAYIYTKGNDLENGDVVIQGDYSDSPEPVEGAYTVKVTRITQNQKGTRTEYRYIL